MPEAEALIQFEEVHFSYKAQTILEKLNLKIAANQFVAVVGLNGAGKSTFLKLIMGLLPPRRGKIQVCGLKPGEFATKPVVGSSLQEVDFPATETVIEILSFVKNQYKDSADIDRLIDDFMLAEFKNKACGQLSGGMKRRLALACAVAGEPKVLLLDEPTTGLDQTAREKLLANLKEFQRRTQCLILMISHHPEEVIQYIDQFLLVKNGDVHSVSKKQMNQYTKLRKLQFECNLEINLDKALQVTRAAGHYSVVSENTDLLVREICASGVEFENMELHKLSPDELMREIL